MCTSLPSSAFPPPPPPPPVGPQPPHLRTSSGHQIQVLHRMRVWSRRGCWGHRALGSQSQGRVCFFCLPSLQLAPGYDPQSSSKLSGLVSEGSSHPWLPPGPRLQYDAPYLAGVSPCPPSVDLGTRRPPSPRSTGMPPVPLRMSGPQRRVPWFQRSGLSWRFHCSHVVGYFC